MADQCDDCGGFQGEMPDAVKQIMEALAESGINPSGIIIGEMPEGMIPSGVEAMIGASVVQGQFQHPLQGDEVNIHMVLIFEYTDRIEAQVVDMAQSGEVENGSAATFHIDHPIIGERDAEVVRFFMELSEKYDDPASYPDEDESDEPEWPDEGDYKPVARPSYPED